MTIQEAGCQMMAMLDGAYLYTVSIHQSLANAAGNDEALSPPRGVVHCALAQASLSESSPQLTGVRTTSQGQVSIDDGVPGRDHGRVARLTVVWN